MNQQNILNKKVIAIGNFDGVHLGHTKVLKTAVNIAEEQKIQAAAMTFFPHPKDYFGGPNTVLKITDEETKTKLILALGVEFHITEPFNNVLANFDAEDFTKMLKEKYACTTVVCGGNFRFGRNAAYGVTELQNACEKFGMNAVVCEYEKGFSSTAIRDFITQGNVSEAAKLLGRNFNLSGIVRHGRHIGEGLGFPTVNLKTAEGLLLPRFGVYSTEVTCEDKSFKGITNVGLAPTVKDGKSEVRTETFLLNTNLNLYEKFIKVEFKDFIRPEIKFESLEQLKSQIKKDLSVITENN